MGSSSTSQKLNFTKVENEIKSLKHFLCRYGLGKGEQWQDQRAKQVGSANCIRYDLTEEVIQNRKRCVNSLKSNIWAEHIPTSFSFYFFWWTLKESHTCDHLYRDTVFLRSARHESDNSSANYTKQQKIIHISVIVERNQTHDSTHFTLHKDKARIGQRKTKPLPYHLQHIMWGWPII